MKTRVLILLMVCCAVLDVSAQDANALLIKVKEKLQKVKDYKGDARLITNVSFMNIPDSKVKVYFRFPDQFKIVKENGVSILPKGGTSVSLNSLISGKDFVAVPGGYVTVEKRKLAVLKLLPVTESSDMVLTTLLVEESSGLVYRSTTTTRENGTYETNLEYGRYAAWGLPDKVLFVFNTNTYKLPKGVTMEYEGSKKAAAQKPAGDGKGRISIIYSRYEINKGIPASFF
ncbi:outer membrane lipoprotein carrier protein LolA [Flavihumibacter stibioxidans]|uniref:Outer membrane lipoprotein-sorting protein n=1 Tax=Flavihumibacter stibioxidans TaxID=1834163 RepID=A0ABR7M8P5_9BACT|nr:hypothetical protein [Flavihumibacter stibioxidans]MBC6490899.1 hypothetical protein [Flavihumibacter stibioxidans]